jgi:hypothetical protein
VRSESSVCVAVKVKMLLSSRQTSQIQGSPRRRAVYSESRSRGVIPASRLGTRWPAATQVREHVHNDEA